MSAASAQRVNGPRTLDELATWCDRALPGTSLDPRRVAELLREIVGTPTPQGAEGVEGDADEPTSRAGWRELIWTVHPETRIGKDELCEALQKSPSWLYKRTSAGTIPHRKFGPDGDLVFVVGEIRDWIRLNEVVMTPPSQTRPHLTRI